MCLTISPELQLDALHGGLGDHGPVPTSLRDGHDRGGGQGGLPQHEAHVEDLEEVLIALLGDPSVSS